MNIGDISRRRGEENERKVHEFFTQNPFATQLECVKFTGLNKSTVNRHFQKLRGLQKDGAK